MARLQYGSATADAAAKSMHQLAQDRALQQAVTVNMETGMLTQTRQRGTAYALS